MAVFKTVQPEVACDRIARIGAVYAIEERIRGTTAETRLRVRRTESRPIMKARSLEVRAGIFGQSSLASAIAYTQGYRTDGWD